MDVIVHLPDDFARHLAGDIERKVLEALALEEYRAGRLGKKELRRTLGFEVLDELDGFLKAHGVFEPCTPADLERERQALDRLGL